MSALEDDHLSHFAGLNLDHYIYDDLGFTTFSYSDALQSFLYSTFLLLHACHDIHACIHTSKYNVPLVNFDSAPHKVLKVR